jgi:hypothetical protein
VIRAGFIAAVLVAATRTALAGPAPALQAEPAPAEPAPAPVSPDDLARAADAAAEVASVPPGDAPPAKPSSDDIDLSALGLDPGAAAFDDKLNLYGFADFTWQYDHFTRDVPLVKNDARGFVVGNLNLYMARNLTAKARALAEVRFTFVPNASTNPDGSMLDTAAEDPSNFNRPVQWGGIVIERAYVEYDVTPYLTIRGGHWLTPYGIWNIDHGSPVIISVNRPFIIGEQFFPEHQTGLDAFGSHTESGFKIGYHLTASNGRGGSEAQQDQDTNVALGGRLELETPWGLRLGGSYYRGRYTGLTTIAGAPAPTFLEAAYGGDAQYDRGPLHLQGELIARERHYEDGSRAAGLFGFTPDGRDLGLYLLAGHRFDQLWNAMPYARYEYYAPLEVVVAESIQAWTAGVNLRPSPSLVLKLQGLRAAFRGGLFADSAFWEYSAQASWVF